MNIFVLLVTLLLHIATGLQPQYSHDSIVTQLRKGNRAFFSALPSPPPPELKAILLELYSQQIDRLKGIDQEVVLQSQRIEPVLKWGQNASHLFLTLKASHRWDSPPCLNTKSIASNLNQKNFNFLLICHSAHTNLTFDLSITFYSELTDGGDSEGVGMNSDGVGIYSLIMKKKQEGVWPYLCKQLRQYPLWQDIGQRYSAQLDLYRQLHPQLAQTRLSSQTTLLWGIIGLSMILLL